MGGCGWERQREITVHEINILVPKGINKDSPRNSGYDTCMDLCNYGSWLSWLKNDFTSIFLGPRYEYDIFLNYLHVHFNVLTTDKLYTVSNI